MGDITWLPFSIDFLCIAAVSKSPLPSLSGHHIFPVPVTSFNLLCIPLLYNKLSKPLFIASALNSNHHLLIGEIVHCYLYCFFGLPSHDFDHLDSSLWKNRVQNSFRHLQNLSWLFAQLYF